MRHALALAILFAFTHAASGDDLKPKRPAEKDVALKVGDPAPPLRATKWLQGAEVKAFAAGKTYVVEFWATWCGPCIVMMPHLSELHAEYKGKGVTFVGFSAKDPNNSLEKVQALVERRGPKLGYAFAYGDDAQTYDAWMTAAGQGGLPCAFVIDGGGRVAYIGHPMYLALVLPKVVAGKWTAADADEVKKVDREAAAVFNAFRGPDAAVGLKALVEFEKKYPMLAGIPYFNAPRIMLLLKTKQQDAAKTFAETLVAKGIKTDDPTLLAMVSNAVRLHAGGDKALLALSLAAAEGALKMTGDRDVLALLTVAEAHFANGDAAKAKAFGARAVAAAENEPDAVRKTVANEVKKFDDGK